MRLFYAAGCLTQRDHAPHSNAHTVHVLPISQLQRLVSTLDFRRQIREVHVVSHRVRRLFIRLDPEFAPLALRESRPSQASRMIGLWLRAVDRLGLYPRVVVPINHIPQGLIPLDTLILGGWHDERVQIHQETCFRSILQCIVEVCDILVIEQRALGGFGRLAKKTLTECDIDLVSRTELLSLFSDETDRARPRSVEIDRDRDLFDAGWLIVSTSSVPGGAGIH
ncbi:hypothetical protein N7540_011105 [Penicillium herquei]|nr:hypothetical protein N7540_011065 [Penicillium herquei]KAJ6016514.1 hypothetical protein N7540_011105 [Penicillium herquei]